VEGDWKQQQAAWSWIYWKTAAIFLPNYCHPVGALLTGMTRQSNILHFLLPTVLGMFGGMAGR
jgi:hypothetical protein